MRQATSLLVQPAKVGETGRLCSDSSGATTPRDYYYTTASVRDEGFEPPYGGL